MNRTHGARRGYAYSVAYHSERTTADVDVFAPDGRHFAFTLGVRDPSRCRLGDHLAGMVEAWIDGTAAMMEY